MVAKAIAAIEARGELDNTIVVITSDHGMPFPRAKASLYDARRAFTLQGEPLRVRRVIEPSHTHMISYRHGGGEWWVMADGGE